MKIGIESTQYFNLNNYKDGIAKAKKHGYDCLDFQQFCPPDGELYSMSEAQFIETLTDIKREADRVCITFSQIHTMWPSDETYDLDTNLSQRENNMPKYIRSLLGAKLLGAENAVFHTALPYGWAEDKDEAFAREVNRKFFASLLPYAEKYDVNICIENLPFKTALSHVKNIAEFIKEFKTDKLKVCLDTGHVNVLREDLSECVLCLGELLACMHVHDNRGIDFHNLPYEGTIKWDEFFSALKTINYKGCFSLETGIKDTMPEPIKEEMQRLLARLARIMAAKSE